MGLDRAIRPLFSPFPDGDTMPIRPSGQCTSGVVSADGRGPRVITLGLVFGISMAIAGCQSAPVLALQGARHYAAGSEALEQGDGERAVHELSLAAFLIPHASEIQNHLGLAYLSEGDFGLARKSFEVAVALDCDNDAAHSNLARLLKPPDPIPAISAVPDRRDHERGNPIPDDTERIESHGG